MKEFKTLDLGRETKILYFSVCACIKFNITSYGKSFLQNDIQLEIFAYAMFQKSKKIFK